MSELSRGRRSQSYEDSGYSVASVVIDFLDLRVLNFE